MSTPRFKYKCTSCDKIHEGFPALAFDLPSFICGIPKSDWPKRCELGQDFCSVDNEHFFVRCIIEYPIIGTDEIMGWGVWGSLSRDNYTLYVKHSEDADRDHLGPFFSWLSNALPVDEYPTMGSVACKMVVRNNFQRPILELEPTDHPLSLEQRYGISLDKALRLIQPIITWHN